MLTIVFSSPSETLNLNTKQSTHIINNVKSILFFVVFIILFLQRNCSFSLFEEYYNKDTLQYAVFIYVLEDLFKLIDHMNCNGGVWQICH